MPPRRRWNSSGAPFWAVRRKLRPPPSVRLFLSFEPPDDVRDALAVFQQRLRSRIPDVRWVRPELLHATMTFLGEVDPAVLAALLPEIRTISAGHRVCGVTYEGVGVFPNARRPNVLWVGVTRMDQTLHRLKTELDAAVLRHGVALEERSFRPHVTLGRFRVGGRVDDLTPTLETLTFEPQRTSVQGIQVMRSDLSARGPAYTVLATNPLQQRTSHQDQ